MAINGDYKGNKRQDKEVTSLHNPNIGLHKENDCLQERQAEDCIHASSKQRGAGPEQEVAGPEQGDDGPGQGDAGPGQGDAGPEQRGAGSEQEVAGSEQEVAGSEQGVDGPGQGDAGPEQRGAGSEQRGAGSEQRGAGSEQRGVGSEQRGADSVQIDVGSKQTDAGFRKPVIYDLYSGTGTIAQVLAPVAERVLGIEIVAEAVEAAKLNAEENGLHNVRFLCGDVLKVLEQMEKAPDSEENSLHNNRLPKGNREDAVTGA
ncbi:MAG: methyltransferase domain-containing protein, partial [Lachnospiraceae bacterium]|nr:methyltransferase domain-containing protein [Lachnospiraceae bacterium]